MVKIPHICLRVRVSVEMGKKARSCKLACNGQLGNFVLRDLNLARKLLTFSQSYPKSDLASSVERKIPQRAEFTRFLLCSALSAELLQINTMQY